LIAIDAVRAGTEVLVGSLDALPAWLGISLVALFTAVIALLAIKHTTDQAKLERSRDAMSAAIYEMRLFLDSPRRVLAAQVRFFFASMAYTARTLPALAIMSLPLGLGYRHLELRYSYAPVKDSALVAVEGDTLDDVTIEAGGRIVGPIAHDGTAYFRIDLDRADTITLRVHAGGATYEKLLVADPKADRISAERAAGIEALFALGAEPSLEDGPIDRIRIVHPELEQTVLFMPWWITWLVLSTVMALLLKNPLRVRI
jgi:hypothetical protein